MVNLQCLLIVVHYVANVNEKKEKVEYFNFHSNYYLITKA